MVIGLDVSTVIVGITALGDDGSLRRVSHVDLRKIDPDALCEKCRLVRKELSRYLYILEPDEKVWVFVEAAARQVVGKTNAKTLFKLARFNGMVSFAAYDLFDSPPVEVAVNSARAKVGWKKPPIPKGTNDYQKKKLVKQSVIDFVLAEHTPDELGFVLTRNDNWQEWCGDRADSYVIAKYGVLTS